jgi:hypothetical protein
MRGYGGKGSQGRKKRAVMVDGEMVNLEMGVWMGKEFGDEVTESDGLGKG